MNYQALDESVLPFSEFVKGLTNLKEFNRIDEENDVIMSVEKIEVESPIELDVRFDENGKLLIGTSPPIYHVDTSIMPVFHQIRITIATEQETNNDGSRE